MTHTLASVYTHTNTQGKEKKLHDNAEPFFFLDGRGGTSSSTLQALERTVDSTSDSSLPCPGEELPAKIINDSMHWIRCPPSY